MSTSDGSTKPLDVQIGGDHYKSMAIQPMEYSMVNKLDACQHTIIKYVTRFRDKGGIQDLEKAKHCIDLLIHFERQASALPTAFGQQNMIDPADVEIASEIDDDSERMQAIGQNGEMASEVYAAVDAMPNLPGVPEWSEAPEWAEWLAMDNNGEWYWYERQISADDMRGTWDYGSSLSGAIRSAAYSSDDGRPDWRSSLQPRPAK